MPRLSLWRELRIGDRIRIVEIPSEFFQKGYLIHPCSLRAYQKLTSRGRSLRVARIDAWGVPWVDFRFKRRDGKWEWHSLAVNHGGLVRVRRRKQR
jgi:hypothetical protein